MRLRETADPAAQDFEKKVRSGPVSRVLFPCGCSPQGDGHFSRTADYPDAQAAYPEAVADRTGPRTALVAGCSLFGLAPSGVCRASLVTQAAGELLPHRFTLTPRAECPRGRFAFCCTFPGLADRWALPTTASYGARTFLSPARTNQPGQRPSGPLRMLNDSRVACLSKA